MDKQFYNDTGLMIVKEDHVCEHFEPDAGVVFNETGKYAQGNKTNCVGNRKARHL